jgi:sugar phosphate isomerase/epimerase
MQTRRNFTKFTAAAALAGPAVLSAAKINSKINGVMIGAQTYSFRDMPLDKCIASMREIGLGYAELFQGHIEPKDRDALAAWRKNPPLGELKGVRKKFDDAGIEIYALNYSFRENWSDGELEHGFEIANALGVKYITASSNVTTSKRLSPIAEKHKIYVAFHNHSNIKPNEFARPEDFAEAMKGASKYIAINLDIGHFTAAGYDPVSYLEEHHDRIITLHIKDRKLNQGENMPFGEGDTKIKEVLQVLKAKRYPIPANIEYEYKGADTFTEVKKCFEYCKAALA